MEKGFIMLSRKFFSNEMWEAARTFSECEAWLDLIQSARFEATDTIECIGGREITYGRGQYPASNRFLANKWRWGEQKVKTFLSKLKRKGMITAECTQGMNIITLVKYDEYNGKNPPNNPVDNLLNVLINNELKDLVTQLVAQQVSQCQPSGNPNNNKENKEEKDIKKESPNGDEKEGGPSSCVPNPDFIKFNDWLERKAPYCGNTKNFPTQITEDEFFKLKSRYSGKEIADIIEQIENRKDLRKRYTNLYRTVLNWAKKEYGK